MPHLCACVLEEGVWDPGGLRPVMLSVCSQAGEVGPCQCCWHCREARVSRPWHKDGGATLKQEAWGLSAAAASRNPGHTCPLPHCLGERPFAPMPPRGAWSSFCDLGGNSGQCKITLEKLRQHKNTKKCNKYLETMWT